MNKNTPQSRFSGFGVTKTAVLFIIAVCSFPQIAKSDSALNYDLDLSTGYLVQSRLANGYLTAVSPSSVTLIGPNDAYYAPGTRTDLIFGGVLDQANNFALINSSGLSAASYLGTSIGVAEATADRSEVDYMTSLGAPKEEMLSNINLPYGPGYLSNGYVFNVPYYELRYSYDYSWTTQDAPGYDSAGGSKLPTILNSVAKSGHVEFVYKMNTLLPQDFLGVDSSGLSSGNVGWYISSVDNVGGAGSLTISNFVVGVTAKQQTLFVAVVPEPETYAMMLAGLGLVGAVARRRKLAKV